jgi:hypothetical protein
MNQNDTFDWKFSLPSKYIIRKYYYNRDLRYICGHVPVKPEAELKCAPAATGVGKRNIGG